jgi:parvulin-like peptidyl-prolyl isomerase
VDVQRRIIMINFGNIAIESETIVDFLKQEMLLKEICQKILTQQIIEQTAQIKNIKVTPEEIQAEADKIRYQMRLEKVSDTLSWLREKMVSVDEWEEKIRIRLLSQKLAKHLFDKEVNKHFGQNKFDFDQLVLYQIVVPNETFAQEILYQIQEEEVSFYQAAHFYDIDEQRRYRCGYEGKIDRRNLTPNIAAVLFEVELGEIIGPLKTEQGYHLLMLKEFIQAELTPSRYQEILDRLFKEWLEGELNYMVYNQAKQYCGVVA